MERPLPSCGTCEHWLPGRSRQRGLCTAQRPAKNRWIAVADDTEAQTERLTLASFVCDAYQPLAREASE